MRIKKKLMMMLVAAVVSLLAMLPVSAVFAAETNLSQTLAVGILSVTSPATAAFIGKTVSSVAQTDAAVIGNATHTDTTGIRVLDDTGSGAGWDCTMTVKHLTTRAAVKKLAGANATVNFTGIYDGLDGVLDPCGTFKVEITTGGAVGTAVFKWWDPAGTLTATVTTASTFTLSNGITVTFAAATYAVGDSWSAGVDLFPYTGLTITPSAIHAASGSLTGVTAGGVVTMSGTAATSGAATVMAATVNNGAGDYYIDVDLSQTIHANSLAGIFTSVATITVI
ncbi:hypothetical protein KJ830_00605 [bacterium]|nr:hypothetical protein [bacterium]MBU4509526.1 hypothetical protein [bacterium]